eukprot:662280-Alexandrium_andersonii.AAC.1
MPPPPPPRAQRPARFQKEKLQHEAGGRHGPGPATGDRARGRHGGSAHRTPLGPPSLATTVLGGRTSAATFQDPAVPPPFW